MGKKVEFLEQLKIALPYEQAHQKMGRRSKQTILQRRHTDGQQHT